MHSVPERSRKEDKRSRFEQYGQGHPYCHLPDVEGFDWLTSAFVESGMVCHGASGPVPLTWQELQAFHAMTGGVYSLWSIGILHQMSKSYVKWLSKGGEQKDLATEVPYIVRNDETMRAAAESIMRSRDKSASLQEGL